MRAYYITSCDNINADIKIMDGPFLNKEEAKGAMLGYVTETFANLEKCNLVTAKDVVREAIETESVCSLAVPNYWVGGDENGMTISDSQEDEYAYEISINLTAYDFIGFAVNTKAGKISIMPVEDTEANGLYLDLSREEKTIPLLHLVDTATGKIRIRALTNGTETEV